MFSVARRNFLHSNSVLRILRETTKRDIVMGQALISVLPLFAPLPGPIVEHLLLGKRRTQRKASLPTFTSPFERETGYTQAEWDGLLQEVRLARQDVYKLMAPLVQRNALSTSWFTQALMKAMPRKEEEVMDEGFDEGREGVSQSTLKEWKDRGLISYPERNQPDAHQAAALLIARMIDRRVRNWLPTTMTPDEARSWCWRQGAPALAPVPCPLPLPDRPGQATLLMTTWSGRVWDPYWQRINGIGAARWAEVTHQDQQACRNMTLEDLRQWDPQVAALHLPLMEKSVPMMQILADIALIRLAFTQLHAQNGQIQQTEPS